MTSAIVTGAGGFAGRWLCRHLLAAGWTVEGWVRRPGTTVGGVTERVVDIRDADACARAIGQAPPDVLFHLAAVTWPALAAREPELAWQVNVGGTRNVLGPLPPSTRAILASTCHVYGTPAWLPVDERHPLRPVGAYATSKAEAEVAAREVHPEVVVVRAFHHTGPGQSPRFALPDWARQVAALNRGEADAVRVGDLSLRRDYTDVRDVVAGYALLAERGVPGATYNLASGRAPRLGELLRLLAGGRMPPIQVDPARVRAGDPPEIRGDPRRAWALGWRVRHGLEDTLAELSRALADPA